MELSSEISSDSGDLIDQHPMRNHVLMLLGQYPHAAPDNPVIYRLSIAEILAAFPERAVKSLVNPVTGFVSQKRDRFGLPELGDIRAWLENWVRQEERLQSYAALPSPQKSKPIGYVTGSRRRPGNLFVPQGFPGYDRMVELRAQGREGETEFDTRVCSDGEKRNGIWVPLNWFHDAGFGRFRNLSGLADVSAKAR